MRILKGSRCMICNRFTTEEDGELCKKCLDNPTIYRLVYLKKNSIKT